MFIFSILRVTTLASTFLAVLVLATAAIAQERATIEVVPNLSHGPSLDAIAVTPDGSRAISTGYSERAFKLWDIASGHLIRTFAGHATGTPAIAISPDGVHLLSGGKDSKLLLWDAARGKVIRTFEGHSSAVSSVAFSPDGTRILSGSSDGTIKLWDTASGQIIRSLEDRAGLDAHDFLPSVNSVAFSPDGTRLLAGYDRGKLRLWDASTGELIRTILAQSGKVSQVAFSPDGTRLVSASDSEPTFKLWDATNGQLIRTFAGAEGELSHVSSVAFSPDGKRLLSGGVKSVLKLWDTESGHLILSSKGPAAAVAFSPDGQTFLSGADPGHLWLWDVSNGKVIRHFGVHTSGVISVAFAPDGSRVVSGNADETLKLWSAESGQLVRTLQGHSDEVLSVAVSPDGARLLSGGSYDKTLKLWDAASGQLIRSMDGDPKQVLSTAFSPDGTRLLSSGRDPKLKLWDAASGQLIRSFEGHSDFVWSVAFSPDGTRLLSGGDDKTLKLWGAESGQLIRTFEGHTAHIGSVAFSPDGAKLVSGSADETLKLWDAATGQLIRTFEGHSSTVLSVTFSSDGTRLLSGGYDGTLKLWDPATGQLIRTLKGHSEGVKSVAFSPDGTRIISGSFDTTIRIWNATTGELLATLFAAGDGEWLAITPEGFFDASAKGADILGVARGLEVYSIDQFYQTLYRPDLLREKLAGDPSGSVRESAAKLDFAKLLDSGRVPQVAITSNKPQDTSAVDLVALEARLTDQGGGIGRAEWRINGITVGVVENVAGTASQPMVLRQAMALDPGENTIELTAYNAANLVASVPARTKITWNGTQPAAPPRLYVLVVGINDYLDAALKLTYAVPDATSLAAAFKEAGQDQYEEVIITMALNGNATADKLDQLFADLASRIRPRDVFMFFAAGHGKTLDGRYYFVPQDLRYQNDQSLVRQAIGQDKLQTWFARIQAKKVVLMFDTCEAGSLTEHRATRGLEQKAALGRLIQATGRATLTASTATQQAYEGYGGHGVFTFALLDALGRADTNHNGFIELAELIQHVDQLVPAITQKRWGATQYPQMDAYGSNFSLARQVAALAPPQGDTMIIPVNPTHVNTEVLSLFKDTNVSGAVVEELPPFTTVTVVKSDRAWVLIAKDGRLLGYAPEGKLHKLN